MNIIVQPGGSAARRSLSIKQTIIPIVRLLIGDPWNRAGLLLVVGGLAVINGWIQYVVAEKLDVKIPGPPTEW
jgi:hypothetical protein